MALDQNVPAAANQIATDLIALNANWEETITYIDNKVSDVVYGATWDTVASIAPSKNAVYDKINAIDTALSAAALLLIATSGTKMWFYQNTAPTGWTITAGIADVAIAVKGGTGSYNVNGGNIAGSWTQPDCTLSAANLPAHDHGSQQPAITVGTQNIAGVTGGGENFHSIQIKASNTVGDEARVWTPDFLQIAATQAAHTHTSVGSGTAHSHGTAYRPYAAVGIICTKD